MIIFLLFFVSCTKANKNETLGNTSLLYKFFEKENLLPGENFSGKCAPPFKQHYPPKNSNFNKGYVTCFDASGGFYFYKVELKENKIIDAFMYVPFAEDSICIDFAKKIRKEEFTFKDKFRLRVFCRMKEGKSIAHIKVVEKDYWQKMEEKRKAKSSILAPIIESMRPSKSP